MLAASVKQIERHAMFRLSCRKLNRFRKKYQKEIFSDRPADRGGARRLFHALGESVMLRLIFAIMVATLEKTAKRS
jgi:hypothetical protein